MNRRMRFHLSPRGLVFWLVLSCLAFSGCERRAWKKAREENTLESYLEFVKEHPGSRFAPRAWQMIDIKSYARARRENTISAYRRYLEEFPEGEYKDRAEERLSSLARAVVERLSLEQLKKVRIRVETDLGAFSFKLFPEQAPRHARNMVYLALIGFYDGLAVSEVIPDFAIKMGDPRGDGLGGPGYMLAMEPNQLPHKRGAVSMWHLPEEPDTAGSQFFICLKDQPQLDGRFTVFGEITEGMETLDEIAKVETTGPRGRPPHRPVQPVYLQRVYVKGLDLEAADHKQEKAEEEKGPETGK